MRLERFFAVGVSLLVVSVFGSVGLGAVAAGVNAVGGLHGLDATVGQTSYYYGTSLSSPQPSPYCLVAGGTILIMCYTPQDLQSAYNYPSHLTGAGQTIVIIDAFGYPEVQSDLNTFDSTFGLPATTLQIVCQGGTCPVFDPTNGDQVSWSHEIALDTQYAHAMAPGAHIVLFVATSDDDLVLEQAVQSAVTMFPHSIISQSFGDPELDLLSAPPSYVQSVLTTGETAYAQAAREGTTVFASAGDYGADNYVYGYTTPNPSYPSSSPWVTAVGGTEGNPYLVDSLASCGSRICTTGLVNFVNNAACELNTVTPTTTPACTPAGYGGEQVWNESELIGAATGGAPSLLPAAGYSGFGVPFYQAGLGLTSRATPDVSYNAAVGGGVFTYWSGVSTAAGLYITGGTSAGSPQWAAITALADQLYGSFHHGRTLGFLNPTLYFIGHSPLLYHLGFHDIRVGNNGGLGSSGFNAGPGWDDATGWGTPNVSNLIGELVTV
jgi:subtilase family serine protease